MNTNSTGATGAVMVLNAPLSLEVEAMTQKLFKTSSMSLLTFSDGGSVRDSHGWSLLLVGVERAGNFS